MPQRTSNKWAPALCAAALFLLPTGCAPAQQPHITGQGPTQPLSPHVRLAADSENADKLPANFRMTTASLPAGTKQPPNLRGMADLRASGSAQFSEQELRNVIKAVGTAPHNIVVVDVRQESHAFVNGTAFRWVQPQNTASTGLSRDAVIAKERQRVAGMHRSSQVFLDHPDTQRGDPITVQTAQTEEQLVTSLGLHYERFTVAEQRGPSMSEVDRFVQLAKSLPSQTWLHVHGRKGAGRTTTFLAMYDMMRNAKLVSLNDILNRQTLIGGQNLLAADRASQERAAFLQDFYEYCRTNPDDFETSYSNWHAAISKIRS